MDLNTVFPRSLKADDFAEGPKTLTIAGFELKEYDEENGKKSQRPCFYFTELPHWLVANKTNTEAIMAATGESDTEKMTGKQITLKKARTQFGSKQVDCIRLVEEGF